MERAFFLDTYALTALTFGAQNYAPFKKLRAITTKLQLMELFYRMLQSYSLEEAERLWQAWRPLCIEPTDEEVKAAMLFKHTEKRKNQKSNLSYVDCIGYCIARRRGVSFLTGDKEFRRRKAVTFVQE